MRWSEKSMSTNDLDCMHNRHAGERRIAQISHKDSRRRRSGSAVARGFRLFAARRRVIRTQILANAYWHAGCIARDDKSEGNMHNVNIPQSVINRVIERCGTAHPHAELDPSRTALVVVDLQNGFMMEGVAHALCKAAADIVPNVNRLASAVRRAGGKVFWIQNTHDEACLDSWSHMHAMVRPDKREHRVRSMSEETLGHQLWAGLDVQPGDVKLQKRRFSALIQGSSDLEAQLRAAGCDTVLITGTVTNVCCESTARDAMMLNFRTVMISDGNAAANDEEHNASLTAFYLTFGDVMDTDFTIQCLERGTAARQAAE
jgi:ureidoacrylate peracid hydrolase